MPRAKKEHLKRRPDGRYACWYRGKFFIGTDEQAVLDERKAYREAIEAGEVPASEIPTLSEYGKAWLKRAKASVRDSTYQGDACLLEKLLKQCGSKPINSVLPSDIKDVYSTDFLGLSDSYVRGAKHLYCSLFDAAVDDGYCRTNPARAKSAAPHKGTKGSHRAITEQEREWINTLCLDHRCRPAVMAMLYEGLRPPEAKAFNITKSVDFAKGEISLTEFCHLERNNHYEITNKGKTDKAARTIPLFTPFREAIKGRSGPLISAARGGELTVTAWRVAYNSYVHDMETAINGMEKRWYRRTKEHKAILARADQLRASGDEAGARREEMKIPPWIPFTVTPYDLRHSFCTMCRDAGVELHTVVEWMGHADSTMVLRIYDEVSENRSAIQAKLLESKLIHSQNDSQRLERSSEAL